MYRLNPRYLRRRRVFLGLSQAEVAQRACIGLRTYHRLENDKKHRVREETARAIADALKTELGDLAVKRTIRMVHSIYIDSADDLDLVEEVLGFELTEAWWWEWTSRGVHVETPVTPTQLERLNALDSVTVASHRLHTLTPEDLRQQLMDGSSKAAATLTELVRSGEVPGGCCPLCKQQLGVDAR